MPLLVIKKFIIFTLLNIVTINRVFSLEIKCCEKSQEYIFEQWEHEMAVCLYIKYNDYYKEENSVDEIDKDDEKLFILLESKDDIKDNILTSYEYEVNGTIYYTEPMLGDGEECIKRTFTVDFSDENPKYKIKLEKIKNNNTYELKLDDNTVLEHELNRFLNEELFSKPEENLDNEERVYVTSRKEKAKPILKSLVDDGLQEKQKKWALFRLKLAKEDVILYFYCNNIESVGSNINSWNGIFNDGIKEIIVVKSNVNDVEELGGFCCCIDSLKKVDISNFEFKKPVNIIGLLASKNLEHFILPKTKMYFNNISYLFKDTNENLKIENLENLEGCNTLENITNCFDNSNIKTIKFPKCKISKETTVYENYSKKSFLKKNNLESIDLSQVTFEKGAGENMFYDNKVKKIIFPESMKNLDKKDLDDIFKNSKIENIKIGEYELNNIDKFDEIPIFIKNPIEYLSKRNEIKEKNKIKPSSNSEVDKENTKNNEKDIETNKDGNSNIIEENKNSNKETSNLRIPNTNCCCLNCSCRG